MNQTAEIIFDDVRPAKLVGVAEGVLGGAVPVEMQQELLGLLRGDQDEDSLVYDDCEIALETGPAVPCVLRFTIFQGRYDVTVQLPVNTLDLSAVALARALHLRSMDVAASNGVTEFYGGLEPATDKGLRFFTGTTPGPLLLDEAHEETLAEPEADDPQPQPSSIADRRKGFFKRS